MPNDNLETFYDKAALINYKADPRTIFTSIGTAGWKTKYGNVLDNVNSYVTKLVDGSLTDDTATELLTAISTNAQECLTFIANEEFDGVNTLKDVLKHMKNKVADQLLAENTMCKDPWKWIVDNNTWALVKNAAAAGGTPEYFDLLDAIQLWRTTYGHPRLGAFAIINRFIMNTQPDTYGRAFPAYEEDGTEDLEISKNKYDEFVAAIDDTYALNLPGGDITEEGTQAYWAAECRRRAGATSFNPIVTYFAPNLMWQFMGHGRATNASYIKAVSKHITAKVSFPGAIKTAYPR